MMKFIIFYPTYLLYPKQSESFLNTFFAFNFLPWKLSKKNKFQFGECVVSQPPWTKQRKRSF